MQEKCMDNIKYNTSVVDNNNNVQLYIYYHTFNAVNHYIISDIVMDTTLDDTNLRIGKTEILNTDTSNSSFYFKRHEFITSKMEVALPCLLILSIATIVGTFGNIFILLSVFTRKTLRKVEGIFIVNLASSDLYVTLVADPMSIIGR